MTAAALYYLRLLAYRQSVIPPVLLYLGLLLHNPAWIVVDVVQAWLDPRIRLA